MENKKTLGSWASALDIANSIVNIASGGFNIYSTVALTQAQIGVYDAQKRLANVQSGIITDSQKEKQQAAEETEALNNAKRRYIYGVATDGDLLLLIKYDLISGYIDEQGNPVEAVKGTNASQTDTQTLIETANFENALNLENIKKYVTPKNAMIALGLLLLYKTIK